MAKISSWLGAMTLLCLAGSFSGIAFDFYWIVEPSWILFKISLVLTILSLSSILIMWAIKQ